MSFGVERRSEKASTAQPLSIWQNAGISRTQRIAKTPGTLLKSTMTTANRSSNGMSMDRFSDGDVLNMADTLSQCPRRALGCHTPSELFDAFLDEVYAIESIS